MDAAAACKALKTKCRLEVAYSGRTRVIEVHAVGYTRDDEGIMRVWQVRGGSAGGGSTGWKLFRLDEIASAKILDEKSEAPRTGYRKGDPAIAKLVCEI
jgi:hypothetical protein